LWSRKVSLNSSSKRLDQCFTRQAAASALHGKDMLPMAGEYTGQVMLDGSRRF
jgi:indolepyruvate ferredoxin oxidoreductase alpha subunit